MKRDYRGRDIREIFYINDEAGYYCDLLGVEENEAENIKRIIMEQAPPSPSPGSQCHSFTSEYHDKLFIV